MSVIELQPETKTSSIADLLDATADEIEKRGWCQGEMEDEYGRVCMAGAYERASGWAYVRWPNPAWSFWRAIEEYLGVTDAIIWNDDVAQTQEQVIAALRASAVIERAKETE